MNAVREINHRDVQWVRAKRRRREFYFRAKDDKAS